jgi:hypothetical protein
MNFENIGGDAIFIKFGWLEVSAVGQVGVTAISVLIVLYIGTRIFLKIRRP